MATSPRSSTRRSHRPRCGGSRPAPPIDVVATRPAVVRAGADPGAKEPVDPGMPESGSARLAKRWRDGNGARHRRSGEARGPPRLDRHRPPAGGGSGRGRHAKTRGNSRGRARRGSGNGRHRTRTLARSSDDSQILRGALRKRCRQRTRPRSGSPDRSLAYLAIVTQSRCHGPDPRCHECTIALDSDIYLPTYRWAKPDWRLSLRTASEPQPHLAPRTLFEGEFMWHSAPMGRRWNSTTLH